MKEKRFAGCLLVIGALFFSILLWMLIARIVWRFGGRIFNAQMEHEHDLSGEYLSEIKTTRLLTTNLEHPFLPDNLYFTNAHITITQFGRTNVVVISESSCGKVATNNIIISGWVWRWGSNRLEYSNTVIGPGLGLGIFPGIVKSKSRCNVDVIQTHNQAKQALHITYVNQRSGIMIPFGPWSDPDDFSELFLTPASTNQGYNPAKTSHFRPETE